MKKIIFLFAFIAVTLVSCNKSGGEKPQAEEAATIKIGHYASLTGKEATFGTEVDAGVKMAVEEINKSGGLLGKQIELITEDTQSNPQGAGNAVEKLIGNDKVVAVIGEVASGRSLIGGPICQRSKVPMVSPASTNEKVTQTGDYIFRICYIDPFQGSVLAKFAMDNLKKKTAALLKDNANAYSVGLTENFKKKFTEMGGQIVEEQSYQGGESDFKAQLTSIKAKNPDVIFVPGYYTETSLIAVQARQLGIKAPLLGGDGWDSPVLTQGAAKDALEGCFFTNHYSEQDTSARVQDFIKKFSALHNGGTPGAMSALGYDAMMIIAKAIKDGGKADSETIKNGITTLKDYQGITGNITIDANRNATKSAVVLEIKGGKFTYNTTVAP